MPESSNSLYEKSLPLAIVVICWAMLPICIKGSASWNSFSSFVTLFSFRYLSLVVLFQFWWLFSPKCSLKSLRQLLLFELFDWRPTLTELRLRGPLWAIRYSREDSLVYSCACLLVWFALSFRFDRLGVYEATRFLSYASIASSSRSWDASLDECLIVRLECSLLKLDAVPCHLGDFSVILESLFLFWVSSSDVQFKTLASSLFSAIRSWIILKISMQVEQIAAVLYWKTDFLWSWWSSSLLVIPPFTWAALDCYWWTLPSRTCCRT